MYSRIYVIRRVLCTAGFSLTITGAVFASTISQDGTFSTEQQSLWQPGASTGKAERPRRRQSRV